MDPQISSDSSQKDWSKFEVQKQDSDNQKINPAEQKTTTIIIPLMANNIPKSEKKCDFKAARPNDMNNVFSKSLNHSNAAQKRENISSHHSVNARAKNQTIAELIARKQEIETSLSTNSFIPMVGKDGEIKGVTSLYRAMIHFNYHDPNELSRLLNPNELSRLVIKFDVRDGENIARVEPTHVNAHEEFIEVDGEKFRIVVDLTPEEIQQLSNLILEYFQLEAQIQQAKISQTAEEKVFIGMSHKPPPQEPSRSVPVKVLKQQTPQSESQNKTATLLLMQSLFKDNRLERERTQEKDDQHDRIEKEVVREGLKKENIRNEAIQYDETHL